VSEQPVLEIDCRGQLCPRPVIELARHLGDVPVGAVLAVVADDAAAAHDVPAWCRMRGHHYVEARPHGDHTAYVVEVRPSTPAGAH